MKLVGLSILYIAVSLGVVGYDLLPSPWLDIVLSLAFIWGAWVVSPAQRYLPLAVVFLVTVIFPVLVMFAIGMPTYHSWETTAKAIFNAAYEHNFLWGLDMLFPFLAATFIAVALRLRSNSSFQGTASGRP